jgi:gliding motility-associated lipoprotein GldH
MSLQLIVEQQLLTSGKLRADTLTCSLIDLQGTPLGDGVSHYQYLLPLNSLMLHQKERLRVAIRHNMKREILPGITDVGIRLTRAH